MKGLQIPTLKEALLFTRDNNWKVNIEIKDFHRNPDDDATVVEKVVSLVEELGMARLL